MADYDVASIHPTVGEVRKIQSADGVNLAISQLTSKDCGVGYTPSSDTDVATKEYVDNYSKKVMARVFFKV